MEVASFAGTVELASFAWTVEAASFVGIAELETSRARERAKENPLTGDAISKSFISRRVCLQIDRRG